MKVLVAPCLDLDRDASAAQVAGTLAGPAGEVVSLCEVGVENLSRPLTQAEVFRLRAALRDEIALGSTCGGAAGDTPPAEDGLVGYVCPGVALPGVLDLPSSSVDMVVAVSDHANLTWRSPLAGPNDDAVGPRFPNMTGIYSPELVAGRLEAQGGIIVKLGVVAGVQDHARLNAYERGSVRAGHHLAVSSELVPVVIVAAHMGLRIAAAVTTWEA